GATVGQGHEGAARELARRLTASGTEVAVHDYLDAVAPPARRVLRDLYAPTVQHAPAVFDGVFRALERPGAVRRVTDGICAGAGATVARWAAGADVVVSTYPLAGQTLGALRRSGAMPATTITYLTDPAAHALWCHPDVDVHLTVTRATASDAARYGVHATAAGPLCAPGFGRGGDGARLRARLWLPRDVPVVLLSAGSLGMGDVPRTIADILCHPTARVLVLCGRNAVLRRRLRGHPRVVALGWRDDVPDLMAAADVLVHNAGGLAVSEAIVAGLPTVTYLPIPGHGRANARVLQDAGLAPWPRDPDALAAAIDRVRPDPGLRPGGRGPVALPWPAGADPADAVRAALGPPAVDHRPVVGL
ncbi:glycosyltransferase, partial [Pseudonocardia sp. KRD291]|uniref:MGDG synthase family glycosyltransferase n=1 Tax=Pseudonocardia sp. KRD291 TaxID=2792007 RepID=UPI001C4A30C4